MSARRFATITASLLARKGEAQPSAHPHPAPQPVIWSSSLLKHPGPDAFANLERSPTAEAETPHNGFHAGEDEHADLAQFSDPGAKPVAVSAHEKRHRVSLAVSAHEHEKLGIVAIKKGLTRHQLLRNALDFYFEKLAGEFQANCACIATGTDCANGCGDNPAIAG